jgi:hypothetical protein
MNNYEMPWKTFNMACYLPMDKQHSYHDSSTAAKYQYCSLVLPEG